MNGNHIAGEASASTDMVKDNHTLGEINSNLMKGSITIHPNDTVAFIEQSFQQKFGLPIQIFRKQKDAWIETTKTDQLTLAIQNQKGLEASAPRKSVIPGDRYLEDGQY